MAGIRQVLRIPGAALHAPVPEAARVGPVVVSSMIPGRVPVTRELPTDPRRQAEVMFQRIKLVMDAAGAGMDAIVNLQIFIMDDAYRAVVQAELEKTFPDPARRPTYHMLNVAPLGLRGEMFEAVLTAVL